MSLLGFFFYLCIGSFLFFVQPSKALLQKFCMAKIRPQRCISLNCGEFWSVGLKIVYFKRKWIGQGKKMQNKPKPTSYGLLMGM